MLLMVTKFLEADTPAPELLKPDTECLNFVEDVLSTAKAARVKCLVESAPKTAIMISITTT